MNNMHFIKSILLLTLISFNINCVSHRVPLRYLKKQRNEFERRSLHDIDAIVIANDLRCRKDKDRMYWYPTDTIINWFIENVKEANVFKSINLKDSLRNDCGIIIHIDVCRYFNYCMTHNGLGILTGFLVPTFWGQDESYHFSISSLDSSKITVPININYHDPLILWWFSPFLNVSPKYSFIKRRKRYIELIRHSFLEKEPEIRKIIENN